MQGSNSQLRATAPGGRKKKRGIPKGYHFLPESEERARLEAYRTYPNDRKAAGALGLRPHIFLAWRHRRGLPPKMPPGKGRRLPPEEEARRRQAYEAGLTSEEAAQRLGISVGAWYGWTLYYGLKAKHDPGPKVRKVSRKQRRILVYLQAHPWSTAEYAAVDLEIDPTHVRDSVVRLARRGLVVCCLHERKKKYAAAGAPLPGHATAFRAGFPNPYHRIGVKEDVLETLRAQAWQMRSEIVEHLGMGITDPAVQYSLRILTQRGDVQSRLYRMPNGHVRLWALRGAPGFRGPHATRVAKAFRDRTGKGAVPVVLLEYVARHPWATVQEVAAGIRRPYSSVVHWTPILEKRGKLQRVMLVEKGSTEREGIATHRQRWALPSAKPPKDAAPAFSSKEVSLLRIAKLVHENPGWHAAEITAKYRLVHGKGTYAWICAGLARLEAMGVLAVDRPPSTGRGSRPGTWKPNGDAPDATLLRSVESYLTVIENARRNLVSLGYGVEVDVRPPAFLANPARQISGEAP